MGINVFSPSSAPTIYPDRDFRIVILKAPFHNWADPEVQRLFCSMVWLKKQCYGDRYDRTVVPVGTADFIGTHQLLCENTPQGLKPVFGFKSVTLDQCKQHRLSFPMLDLIKASGSVEHEKILTKIISDAEKNHRTLTYNGSAAMLPEIDRDPVYRAFLRDAFFSIYTLHHLENGMENVAGFSVTFKIERYYKAWGYKLFSSDGKILAPIKADFALGEPIEIGHLSRFRAEAIEFSQRFKKLWDSRLIIGSDAVPEIKKAA